MEDSLDKPINVTAPVPRAKRLASGWFLSEISLLLNASILSSSSITGFLLNTRIQLSTQT